jgi:hypothetical protein
MKQIDWVNEGQEPRKPFKDIRNQRDSVAEEKARLLLELGELINKAPPKLMTGGTVKEVREWKAAREAAAKVAGNRRSSVMEIGYQIKNMRAHW